MAANRAGEELARASLAGCHENSAGQDGLRIGRRREYIPLPGSAAAHAGEDAAGTDWYKFEFTVDLAQAGLLPDRPDGARPDSRQRRGLSRRRRQAGGILRRRRSGHAAARGAGAGRQQVHAAHSEGPRAPTTSPSARVIPSTSCARASTIRRRTRDPQTAVRTALDYILAAGDSWHANTPRRGGVLDRVSSVHQETSLCVGCHATHFPLRAQLYATRNGYPVVQRQQLQFLTERFYNNPRPFYGFEAAGRGVGARDLGAGQRAGPHVASCWTSSRSRFPASAANVPRGHRQISQALLRGPRQAAARRDQRQHAAGERARSGLVRVDRHARPAHGRLDRERRGQEHDRSLLPDAGAGRYRSAAVSRPDPEKRGAHPFAAAAGRAVVDALRAGAAGSRISDRARAVGAAGGRHSGVESAGGEGPSTTCLRRQQAFGGWMDPLQSFENFRTPFRETQMAVLALSSYFPARAAREGLEFAAPRRGSRPIRWRCCSNSTTSGTRRAAGVRKQIERPRHSNDALIRQAAVEALGRLGSAGRGAARAAGRPEQAGAAHRRVGDAPGVQPASGDPVGRTGRRTRIARRPHALGRDARLRASFLRRSPSGRNSAALWRSCVDDPVTSRCAWRP